MEKNLLINDDLLISPLDELGRIDVDYRTNQTVKNDVIKGGKINIKLLLNKLEARLDYSLSVNL